MKEKIASKANSSQLKQELLKSTVHNLSKSFRSVRGCEIISEREASREASREKGKPELSKVQCMNIKIAKEEAQGREGQQGGSTAEWSSKQPAADALSKHPESNKITVCSSR